MEWILLQFHKPELSHNNLEPFIFISHSFKQIFILMRVSVWLWLVDFVTVDVVRELICQLVQLNQLRRSQGGPRMNQDCVRQRFGNGNDVIFYYWHSIITTSTGIISILMVNSTHKSDKQRRLPFNTPYRDHNNKQ